MADTPSRDDGQDRVALPRRGFVFPSSEIYGGLGSTYDYGHYGVLMKNNIRLAGSSRWCRSATTSSRSTPRSSSTRRSGRRPATSPASATRSSTAGPASSASAPTGSRTRSAASAPSKRPGETRDCDLTEARQFNLMFETQVGAMEDAGSTAYLRPETAQGIFINFKNVAAARAAQAAVRDRADRQVVPQRDHARQLPLPRARVRADGDGVLRAARRGRAAGTSYWIEQRFQWYLDLGLRREPCCACASTTPRSARTTRAATSDIEYLYPIGWQELEGIANRGDFDLTQHTQHSGTKLEWVGQDGERYTPHVIEPAVGDRADLRRDARRRLRRGGGRRPRAHRAAAASADRAGQGGDPAADRARTTRWSTQARALHEELRRRHSSSTTTAARSAGATAVRTRSARRGRSRSTSRHSRTTPSPCATATRSRRSGCRSSGVRELARRRARRSRGARRSNEARARRRRCCSRRSLQAAARRRRSRDADVTTVEDGHDDEDGDDDQLVRRSAAATATTRRRASTASPGSAGAGHDQLRAHAHEQRQRRLHRRRRTPQRDPARQQRRRAPDARRRACRREQGTRRRSCCSRATSAKAEARFSPDVTGNGRGRPAAVRAEAHVLRVTVAGGGTVDAPISPPTPVCERGTLSFSLFTAG